MTVGGHLDTSSDDWSVATCVAVYCSVLLGLECAAVYYSVLQCVAVCCSVLQCVAMCCNVLPCVHEIIAVLGGMILVCQECAAVSCSELQCVAVC